MIPQLNAALESATLCKQDLQWALHDSSKTEAIILLQIIEESAKLCGDIALLRSALTDGEVEK